MADERTGRRGRLRAARSFVAGGLLGGVVVVATRRRRAPSPLRATGLAAFEGAPCQAADADGRTGDPAADGRLPADT